MEYYRNRILFGILSYWNIIWNVIVLEYYSESNNLVVEIFSIRRHSMTSNKYYLGFNMTYIGDGDCISISDKRNKWRPIRSHRGHLSAISTIIGYFWLALQHDYHWKQWFGRTVTLNIFSEKNHEVKIDFYPIINKSQSNFLENKTIEKYWFFIVLTTNNHYEGLQLFSVTSNYYL